jgi:hypothetical protein
MNVQSEMPGPRQIVLLGIFQDFLRITHRFALSTGYQVFLKRWRPFLPMNVIVLLTALELLSAYLNREFLWNIQILIASLSRLSTPKEIIQIMSSVICAGKLSKVTKPDFSTTT